MQTPDSMAKGEPEAKAIRGTGSRIFNFPLIKLSGHKQKADDNTGRARARFFSPPSAQPDSCRANCDGLVCRKRALSLFCFVPLALPGVAARGRAEKAGTVAALTLSTHNVSRVGVTCFGRSHLQPTVTPSGGCFC